MGPLGCPRHQTHTRARTTPPMLPHCFMHAIVCASEWVGGTGAEATRSPFAWSAWGCLLKLYVSLKKLHAIKPHGLISCAQQPPKPTSCQSAHGAWLHSAGGLVHEKNRYNHGSTLLRTRIGHVAATAYQLGPVG